ncbi:MAG: Acetolactate synthase large subunit IlvG [Acidimicrobiales bacterium]|nr:MAG: thiamine pyrophosphate-binding protein [Actinomycetota bacterium]MBV6508205.1 Acetolactate synthase large subunit IlvG [Acidimicrobiales bacterium]RIK07279.1 MAG: acetolactate synthase large subunit [Acidobacteriota bacterium]
MTRIDGGELMIRAMQAEGIPVIFTISDIGQSPMLRSAENAGMALIGPRHESAGVHMADAWARSSGQMAAVAAAAGPGVANMVPGLMCAWMEGVPVFAIGTQRVRRSLQAIRRGRFQYGPQVDVLKPVTKFAATVESASRIPEFVREATRQALSGRQGPVFLELPTDVLLEEVDEDEVTISDPVHHRFTPGTPDAEAIAAAAEMLATARFPLILAGHGVHRGDAATELLQLAEFLGALVMTSAGARGAVPEDHPQSVGMSFPWGTPAHLQSDVVLAVGTQLGETVQYLSPPGWADPAVQKVVHLDVDPTHIGVNRSVDIALVGDAKKGLAALLAALRHRTEAREPIDEASTYAREYHELKRALVDPYLTIDSAPVHPGRLAAELAHFISDDTIVCIDGGNTGLWAHLAMTINHPRSLLWTGHFGHLGTGLPYAMGAKLANPDRPVVLFSGDGAFGFNLQELETAARVGIPLLAVINCDYAWGMEEVYMQKVAGTTVGVKHSVVRYDEVARALGCHGELVDKPTELRPALERSVASGGPAVVQVVVDDRENINPPGLDDFTGMYAAEST